MRNKQIFFGLRLKAFHNEISAIYPLKLSTQTLTMKYYNTHNEVL